MHHNPCFNLFILHNIPFGNQGSEINKNDKRYFFTFRHTVFYKNFPTLYIYMYIYIYIYVIILELSLVTKTVLDTRCIDVILI